MFSYDFLVKLWFGIYQDVVRNNEKLETGTISEDALVSIATTIFITAGQRGFIKAPQPTGFQREMNKLTAKVKDHSMQESIFKTVRMMINGKAVEGMS